MSDKNVLIQVTDLKKHYNKGEIKALDGVSLEIDQGEVVVIIGPSAVSYTHLTLPTKQRV